jgi:Ulp1 family protease
MQNALRTVGDDDDARREQEILATIHRVQLKRRDIRTLQPGEWLNDHVINAYLGLLIDAAEGQVMLNQRTRSSFAFSTFFHSVLLDGESEFDFASVERWTQAHGNRAQGVDLFSMDMVFVPVNIGRMHWALAVIKMRQKRIEYYDSLHKDGRRTLEGLFLYLQAEHLSHKLEPMDTAGWQLENVCSIPRQTNGCDCGVFLCTFAECLLFNHPVTSFDTSDTAVKNRLRMAWSLKNKKYIGHF